MSSIGKVREPDWAERAAKYASILKDQGPNKLLPGFSYEMRAMMVAFSQEIDTCHREIKSLREQVSRLTNKATRYDAE